VHLKIARKILKGDKGGKERVIEGVNMIKVYYMHAWKYTMNCRIVIVQLIYTSKMWGKANVHI
jgi:hypothetical protein